MSHATCSANDGRFMDFGGGHSRDLALLLAVMRITKAVEGHMRTDERWPTSVFHECRQRDEFWDVVGGGRDGNAMAVRGLMGSALGDDDDVWLWARVS